MPVSDRDMTGGSRHCGTDCGPCVRAVCVLSCSTWCGETVLPGGLVVVQRLKHDVHGECKEASQENVENYIKEENKTCRDRQERVL